MSSGKWRPFCFGLNIKSLQQWLLPIPAAFCIRFLDKHVCISLCNLTTGIHKWFFFMGRLAFSFVQKRFRSCGQTWHCCHWPWPGRIGLTWDVRNPYIQQGRHCSIKILFAVHHRLPRFNSHICAAGSELSVLQLLVLNTYVNLTIIDGAGPWADTLFDTTLSRFIRAIIILNLFSLIKTPESLW